jgi:hypothetical protein
MKFEIGLEADFYGVDCYSFKLDDCVFEAVEDESDGYRSCMEEIRMKDDTSGLIFLDQPLARVRIEKTCEGHYGGNDADGFALVDLKDGFVWLKFGTDHADDYYPSFMFNYQHKYEVVLSMFEQ